MIWIKRLGLHGFGKDINREVMESKGSQLKSVSYVFVILALATFLSGCFVTFTNSLPNSQLTGRDERLFGTWEGLDPDGNQSLIRFERGSNGETKVTLPGSSGFRNVNFKMVTAKIKGSNYMVLTLAGPGNDQ